jgi:hypothetical protein
MFASEIRRNRISGMRAYSNWQWHLDEVFVKIKGDTRYLDKWPNLRMWLVGTVQLMNVEVKSHANFLL